MRGRKYFLVYEMTFLSLMATLVYVLMTYFKTPMHFPGHMAVFWVIPFIVGIGVTRKFGSCIYIGVLAGLLLGTIGGADKGPFEVFEYIAMGFTMDILAVVFKGHLGNILVGCILGAFGSFDKLLVNYSITSALALNVNVLIAGIGLAGAIHLIFGGAGGIASSAIVNRVQRLHFFPNQATQRSKTQKTASVASYCRIVKDVFT